MPCVWLCLSLWWSEPASLALWIRSTLEASAVEVVTPQRTIHGFRAGDGYPQIWLRDSATILPAARYQYGRQWLEEWLEEHLARQLPDGQLWDWIGGRGQRKNTTETDQESSAVLAACQLLDITGDRGWFERRAPELERALSYPYERRLDPGSGLIRSALTADWGDVSPAYPDRRALQLDANTPQVEGLYTNGLFIGAAACLARGLQAVGLAERAALWRERGERLKAQARKLLWREELGFYAMWVGDDSGRFAMGGNAVALLYGLATPEQAGGILAAAEAGRRLYGVSTIAGALLPPFPQDFFKLPRMREPWSYQNGGQWDWFAGRLLLAAFRTGHSEFARRHLRALTLKAWASGGLWEWHTREGLGMGSPRYAGSAGVLAGALYEGLYGIELDSAGLRLSVRLAQAGSVSLRQPATGDFVRYSFTPGPGDLLLDFEGSPAQAGPLRLLLPPGRGAQEALLDGQPVAWRLERIGEDAFVSLRTDWKPHQLRIRLEGPPRSGG